jgi:hypothetical protein
MSMARGRGGTAPSTLVSPHRTTFTPEADEDRRRRPLGDVIREVGPLLVLVPSIHGN